MKSVICFYEFQGDQTGGGKSDWVSQSGKSPPPISEDGCVRISLSLSLSTESLACGLLKKGAGVPSLFLVSLLLDMFLVPFQKQ